MLAERMGRVSASPTLKVLVEADKLRQQGVDVVEFGAGEPDFPTPDHVKAAAHAAIDANFTKYTPAAGTSELKQAIATRYKNMYGVDYKPNEVIVTAGGKQALYNVALALFGAGRRGDHARAVLADAASSRCAWPTPRRSSSQTYAENGLRARRADAAQRRHARTTRASSSTRPAIRPAR